MAAVSPSQAGAVTPSIRGLPVLGTGAGAYSFPSRVSSARQERLTMLPAAARRARIELMHGLGTTTPLHAQWRPQSWTSAPPADLLAALADGGAGSALLRLRAAYNDALEAVGTEGLAWLRLWPTMAKSATDDQFTYTVRGKEIRGDNYVPTLSHNRVPKLAVPRFRDWGEQLTFLLKENLPGTWKRAARFFDLPVLLDAGAPGADRFHYRKQV